MDKFKLALRELLRISDRLQGRARWTRMGIVVADVKDLALDITSDEDQKEALAITQEFQGLLGSSGYLLNSISERIMTNV
jgi:hypothetical protein